LQALSSRTTPKPLRLERGSLEPENVYGQEKLCTKNPTHDCRCGQIKARTKDCAKGSNRCGDYCRHCRRRRSGHEVNGRPERPDAENRGERAVWKKQNEDGQDRAKEKTLSTKASKFERPPTPALFHAVALIGLLELRTRDNMRAIYCKNRNGATLKTLFSGPRPFSPPEHAVVRAGLMTPSPGPFFLPHGRVDH
jgi:hypothetical protein